VKKSERYYQRESKDAVLANLSKGIWKQLLVLATGCGKTFTTVSLLPELQKYFYPKDEKQLRTLWATHSEELQNQSGTALLAELDLMPYDVLKKTIKDAGGLIELIRDNQKNIFASDEIKLIVANIGIIKADLFIIDKPYVIASLQTLWRRLEKISDDYFDVMVIDEAHIASAKTFLKSIEYFKVKLRLGLTGTPHRADGAPLADIFEKIVYEYNIDKGIKDGFLCELNAIRVKSNINIDTVRTTAGEFNQHDLEVIVNTPERNSLIVSKYKEYADGRQFLAYCVDVQHARDLNQAFVDAGYPTNFIVGDENLTPDRKDIWERFTEGELIGLTNCQILVAGVDFPDLGCTIGAAPTKSLTKYLQSVIGRLTRIKSQKFVDRFGQNGIVLDIVDGTTRHKLINTWTLDSGKRIEEKTFLTKKQKTELIEKRDRKFIADPKQKTDVKVDLFKMPEVIQSDSYKMQEEATADQMRVLIEQGYPTEDITYTKLQASIIISNLPAKESVCWVLRNKFGYNAIFGVTTYAESTLAFAEIRKREEATKKEAAKKQKVQQSDFDNLFEDVF